MQGYLGQLHLVLEKKKKSRKKSGIPNIEKTNYENPRKCKSI